MSAKLGALKIINPTGKVHKGTVIFFHGSGDTGGGVLDWVKFLVPEFSFPHLKVLFPTAPMRPYTPLGGEKSNVWFDRYDITPDVPEHKETLESIEAEVISLVDKEVQNGIPLNKIIVGGFSMGGALALHTAYRITPGLGGVFTLSSFLNKQSLVYDVLKNTTDTPFTPFTMYHGDHDTMVPLKWGQKTYEKLTELGVKGEFHTVKNTFHELKKKEIEDLFKWINEVLPDNK